MIFCALGPVLELVPAAASNEPGRGGCGGRAERVEDARGAARGYAAARAHALLTTRRPQGPAEKQKQRKGTNAPTYI